MAVTIPLKDLCTMDITDGTHKTPTYVEEGHIFLSSKNVTSGVIDWDNVMYIPASLHDELYKRIAPQKNDILLAKNGTTGVAAIVDRDEVFDIYVSLALIRPDETKVLPRYLLHAINSYPTKQFFDSHLKGIGVPNLHLTHIRETPIRVPSFTEQKQITDVLDKVDELIALRKKQLAKLDQLVKSRFIEMFGDPVRNDKGWQQQAMDKVAPSSACSWDSPESVWLLNLDMVEAQTGRIIDYLYVEKEQVGNSTCGFDEGNVLYSKLRPYLNKVVVPTKKGYCTTELVPLRPNAKLNRQFLAYLLRSDAFVSFINEKVAGAKMPRVSMNVFREFECILPPIDLQNEFAAFVEQTDKSKVAIQQSLDKLELLKKSLMQEYFG